jgi:hypothetical protein
MFRLALALGMTVKELEQRMTSEELTEWMAFYTLEPFGCEAADIRAGGISATIANAFSGKNKQYDPTDFVIKWGGNEEMDDDELKKVALLTNAMLGGTVKRGGDS